MSLVKAYLMLRALLLSAFAKLFAFGSKKPHWQPLTEWQKRRALGLLRQNLAINQQSIQDNRREAAVLIQMVLDGDMTSTQALVRWPVVSMKYRGNDYTYDTLNMDPSLQVAYQMLWHFEADEVHQQQEEFYMDTQLALLEQVRAILAKGQDIPAYLLAQYTTEHEAHFYDNGSFGYFVKKRLISPIQQVFETIEAVCSS